MNELNVTFALRLTSYNYDSYPTPVLYVYSSPLEAAQKEEGIEILEGDLTFFAADGSPLEPLFTQQPYIDSDRNKYFAGVYSLKTSSGKKLQVILEDIMIKNPTASIIVKKVSNKLPKSFLQFFPNDIKTRIKSEQEKSSEYRNSLRTDLKVICDIVQSDAKVLDIGCGDGELLKALKERKNVSGRGIELDQGNVSACLAAGLSVMQGDADTDLSFYPSDSFDYAILTQTLQATKHPDQILKETLRIARKTIVALPNFGHWRNRFQLLLDGKMPVTKKLSYEWYETPNIHFCTLHDFINLCKKLEIKIEKSLAITAANKIINFTGPVSRANLFGEQGIFLLER